MKMGLIVLNGTVTDCIALKEHISNYVSSGSFEWVIGVDGGTKWLEILEITPNQILGDMDSIVRKEFWKNLWPKVEFTPFPPEKNDTDSELAVKEMLKNREIDHIVIVGALGGRADHMLGNIFLLKQGLNKVTMVLIDEQNRIEMVRGPHESVIDSSNRFGSYFSIVPISECIERVCLTGFKYPLNNATIRFGETIGISNEINEIKGSISIAAGTALLIQSKDLI